MEMAKNLVTTISSTMPLSPEAHLPKQNLLMSHVYRNHICEVQNILINFPNDVDINKLDPDGVNSLHVCAALNYINLIQVLLNFGGSIDQKNISGYTSLHIAAACGNRSIVKLLLRKNADPYLLSRSGEMALDLAKTNRIRNIIIRRIRKKSLTSDTNSTNLSIRTNSQQNIIDYIERRYSCDVNVNDAEKSEYLNSATNYFDTDEHRQQVKAIVHETVTKNDDCITNVGNELKNMKPISNENISIDNKSILLKKPKEIDITSKNKDCKDENVNKTTAKDNDSTSISSHDKAINSHDENALTTPETERKNNTKIVKHENYTKKHAENTRNETANNLEEQQKDNEKCLAVKAKEILQLITDNDHCNYGNNGKENHELNEIIVSLKRLLDNDKLKELDF